MNISIEITLMPLNDNYKDVIKDFILSIRNSEFKRPLKQWKNIPEKTKQHTKKDDKKAQKT